MPSYTPEQASWLRSKILTELDTHPEPVDIDERFVKPMFGSMDRVKEWAESWNLKLETYTIPNAKGKAYLWLRFTHPDQPIGLVPPEDDDEL